jgi:hypothetical protein
MRFQKQKKANWFETPTRRFSKPSWHGERMQARRIRVSKIMRAYAKEKNYVDGFN